MRTLAAIACCVVAVAGCQDRAGTRSFTRASSDGHDTLFGKVESRGGVSDFHCLASNTGHCHFLLFVEDCLAGRDACQRRTLRRLDLRVGQDQRIEGLPAGFRHCMDGKAPGEDCARG